MLLSLLPISLGFEISVARPRLGSLSATPVYDFDWSSKGLFKRLLQKRLLHPPAPSLNTSFAAEPSVYNFEPHPDHAPSDVILGVLNALRYDSADRLFLESRGCRTLVRCAAPTAVFREAEPLELLKFFAKSKYEILMHWRKVAFERDFRLSRDKSRAFQTTKLKDLENNWVKVKWTLVLDGYHAAVDDGDDGNYYYNQEGEEYLGMLHDDVPPNDKTRSWLVESVIVEKH